MKVEDIDFPFELVSVSGRDSVQKLEEYRRIENSDFFLVALGDRGNLAMVLENLELSETTTEQILAKARELDANLIFDEIAVSDRREFQETK